MWRQLLASTLLAVNMFPAVAAAQQTPTLLISNVTTRGMVARAISGAIRRLESTSCQRVLDEFADKSGKTLRVVLDEASVAPGEFLTRLRFADGNGMRQCERRTSIAAFTVPGNRVVFVCGKTFDIDLRDEMRAAEMIIIHEMLHAAGLGENPPASSDITARVTKRCGGA